ncbi:Synaptic functional regulator fmr1, variant 2 [Schistosoma haematobium]|uniref:Synaptic functional regulator fmr1, variant 2 n=1 Tax=Schistosoma haematobium TaxID=6185 RepID=A0A922LTL2_SCHHA|nr:Synaptic functional regulator fmr1, variant 2 [Schistosoma haematobium]KAH9593680.1 Synaptic functional regulator fmr1, variant 2 [Schistosoma haematobium]
MIGIEVKGRLNQYVKAILRNVVDENVIVFYPEKNEEEQVPIRNVRLPPTSERDVHPGQNGEALFSVVTDQTPGSSSNTITLTGRWGDETNSKPEVELILDDQLNYLPIPSWWPCRVVKIRDDVAVVKLNVSPPADATPSEISLCTHLSTVTEIVSRKSLRQPSDDCPCLSPDIIHRHRIEIPKELADFASDPSVHHDFLRHCGGPVSLHYDNESSCLVVLTTDPVTAKNVALLEDTHLRMLRQKWALTRSLRQTIRNLETPEAAKQARAKLEYSELYLGVPRRYVGRLIGKRTSNIMSIIRKSGVVHIHFDDHIEGSVSLSDDNNQTDVIKYSHPGHPLASTMRRVFLKAGSAQTSSQPYTDEEYGGFILAGTRDSIEKARLLINFQMDYFYDLEKMESEKLELMRSLSHGGVDSGPVYPARGTAVGRWGERGGVGNYGRGGRGRRPGRGGLLHPPVSDVNHGHYTDDENIGNPIPCRGAKRTPRETYGHRSAGGRIPRQSGRGSRRIGGPGRDSNWNNLMNNNGDVADRRRGSGDSDVLESDNLPDGLSAERANAGRHNRVGRHSPAPNGFYSDRERGDESEDTLNPSNENNFPCGDASSEDGGGCSVDNMRSRLNKYVHSRRNSKSRPHVAHIQLVPKIPTSGIPIVNSTTSIHLLVVRSYVVVVRVIILPDSSRRK